MDKRNWKIIYENYSGAEKKALDLISTEMGSVICRDSGVYTLYVMPCEKEGAKLDKNTVVIGTYDKSRTVQKYVKREEIPENGYLVKVTDNAENGDLKTVIITGLTPINVFYAAADFCDDYLPTAAKVSGGLRTDAEAFDVKIPDYVSASAPKTEKRSIFTWGHPINDFKKYIDNAARCRINQLIIWNDYLPLNAKEIMDYAHEYNMELIWGFAWGWDVNGSEGIDMHNLEAVKEKIIKNFKENYLGCGDGIYFQSFTEREEDRIDGVLIAEAVVNFVNDVAAEIYKICPDIHLQFGLHATSVKDHIEYFEKVDKRIEIVWEDCGVFPYHYLPKVEKAEDFEKTFDFTKKIINLRDRGKTGLVYKGLMTMDWTKFAHQSGRYVMGRSSDETAENDRKMLSPIWRHYTADWLVYGRYVHSFTERLHKEGSEKINLNTAAQLDGGIFFPFALLSQIMWNSDEPYEKILSKVANRKCVKMN